MKKRITTDELIKCFRSAHDLFLKDNSDLFEIDACEMTFCGALMISLYEVNVEYNRYGTIKDPKRLEAMSSSGRIRCDLIVHRRGENLVEGANLIAVEMKKSYQTENAKNNDRGRLEALTIPLRIKKALDIGDQKGKIVEGRFGYKLGVYFEPNVISPIIEYYKDGKLYSIDNYK